MADIEEMVRACVETLGDRKPGYVFLFRYGLAGRIEKVRDFAVGLEVDEAFPVPDIAHVHIIVILRPEIVPA